MYGVDRLSRIFESWPDRAAMAAQLQDYDARLQADIDFLDPLIHGCYRALPTFPLLAAFTMYYFAGAIYSEERRRNGTAGEDDGFLHSHDRSFRRLVLAAYRDLLEVTSGPEGQSVDPNVVDAFTKRVASDIEPWNTTGLCHPARENMYRYG